MILVEQLITPSDTDVAAINSVLNELKQDGSAVEKSELEDFLARDTVELWVARDDGMIVGMASLIEIPMMLKTKMDVEDVVVSPSQQGKGIGKMLMQKIIERAKEKGAAMVELTSRPTREAANALYQKVGFEKRDTNCYRLTF